MKIAEIALLAGCASLFLGGCSATHRNSQIMGPNGPSERTVASLDNTRHSDHIRRFLAYADEASLIGFRTETGERAVGRNWAVDLNDDHRNYLNQRRIHNFMDSGFLLISENCRDYFWALGTQQRRANVLRDSVGPITALIAGILNIVSPGGGTNGAGTTSNDTLAAISVGTIAITSSLDIYEERFLFGAENIISVSNLVQQALGAHRRAAIHGTLPVAADGTVERLALSYEVAARRLRENQDICTPANILSLTQQAIAAGQVRRINRPSPAPSNEEDQGNGATPPEPGTSPVASDADMMESIQVGVPTPQ